MDHLDATHSPSGTPPQYITKVFDLRAFHSLKEKGLLATLLLPGTPLCFRHLSSHEVPCFTFIDNELGTDEPSAHTDPSRAQLADKKAKYRSEYDKIVSGLPFCRREDVNAILDRLMTDYNGNINKVAETVIASPRPMRGKILEKISDGKFAKLELLREFVIYNVILRDDFMQTAVDKERSDFLLDQKEAREQLYGILPG
jgi:hypothetical protein